MKNESQADAGDVVISEAVKEWTAAWKVIVAALKEMGVTDVDHNAAAILARLAHSGMLVVFSEAVKD